MSFDKDNEKDDDDISIDFSKFTKFFKRKSEKQEEDKEVKNKESNNIQKTEVHKEENVSEAKAETHSHIKNEDSEEAIDFGDIKNKIKGFFKSKDDKNSDGSGAEQTGGVINFFKTNKYALPVLLILIAIFFSAFFRSYTYYLPITDDWAQKNVENYYKNQVSAEIDKQYPNLPDANKAPLIEQKYTEFLETNAATIKQQIKENSNYLKSKMQDENGETYMPDIDPYYWYAEARNYVRYGQLGDSYDENGKRMFSLRNGRLGKGITDLPFHPILEAKLYQFASFFNKNITLMNVVIFLPILIIGLSIIPAFFIGKKIGGNNISGFFTAIVVAINYSLLGRTMAGVTDTDAYNSLFPLFILWIFVEALEAKNLKKTILLSVLCAILTGFYSIAWAGWWFVFDFIFATLGICVIYEIFKNTKMIKEGIKKLWEIVNIQKYVVFGLIMFFGSMLTVSVLKSFHFFWIIVRGPFGVMSLKEVAMGTAWPNVITTVAEFNTSDVFNIINHMGGKFLFLIAIIGIILLFIKKKEGERTYAKYAILFVIWMIATTYGFTKGTRFAILMVPAFAVSFGACLGIAYSYITNWMSGGIHVNKIVSKMIVIALFCLLLLSPLNAADATAKQGGIPLINDEWHESLDIIKNNTNDSVITSWWDFGHWFYSLTEKRVTFDGADQRTKIYWVGKSLITSDEDLSIGILRMLNCGQEKSFEAFNKNYNHLESYDPAEPNVAQSIELMEKVIKENDKTDAKKILLNAGFSEKEAVETLNFTHCDNLLDQYFITSDDMIGKSGVWGHFGSWDFNRAVMYQSVKNLDSADGIALLEKDFNLTAEQADAMYYEIQNNEADKWISSWPSYSGNMNKCDRKAEILKCTANFGQAIPIEINLNTYEATIPTGDGKEIHPKSLVYADEDQIKEKEYNENFVGVSVIIVPDGENYYIVASDPLQANSMFTRLYFFNGHGLKHFKLLSDKTQLTGGKIQVWKVDWKSNEANNVFEEKPVEEIKASHIIIMTDKRSDEEALKIIQNISEQANKDNFAELAKKYSEDGAAANGGDLGWFAKGAMIKEFEDAAFAMTKQGEISSIIKTQYGYHLIELTGKRTRTGEIISQKILESVKEEGSKTTDESNKKANPSDNQENKSIEFDITI